MEVLLIMTCIHLLRIYTLPEQPLQRLCRVYMCPCILPDNVMFIPAYFDTQLFCLVVLDDCRRF